MRDERTVIALGDELLRIQPADPVVDQGVMVDHHLGVLILFIGPVGQVVDVQTHMVRREVLHLNIPCELNEQSQDIPSRIGEWAADATRERTMRERHKWFMTQAHKNLSVRE